MRTFNVYKVQPQTFTPVNWTDEHEEVLRFIEVSNRANMCCNTLYVDTETKTIILRALLSKKAFIQNCIKDFKSSWEKYINGIPKGTELNVYEGVMLEYMIDIASKVNSDIIEIHIEETEKKL